MENSGVGNYNWIRLTTASSSSTPYGGTPVALPGTVQAERFDAGGRGVAYIDTTTGNSGGQVPDHRRGRPEHDGRGRGLQRRVDPSGGVAGVLGDGGERGTYTLDVRVANVGTGARFHVEIDGVDRTGPISVPNTGGWQTWQTVTRTGLSLTAGSHVITLVFDTGTANGGVGNYNWVRFVAS